MHKLIVFPARVFTILGTFCDCIVIANTETGRYRMIETRYGEYLPIKCDGEEIYIVTFAENMTNINEIQTGYVAYNIKPFLELNGLKICAVKMSDWIIVDMEVEGRDEEMIKLQERLESEIEKKFKPDSAIIEKKNGKMKMIIPMKTVEKKIAEKIIEEFTNTHLLEYIGKVI
jgi:hypothetical protein